MERERKFLVNRRPAGLNKHPHKRIRQGYLVVARIRSPDGMEIRIRERAGKHVITVKGGHGASRAEVETPIDRKTFASLWRLTAGRRIEKTRYRIPSGGLTVELDVYHGKLNGLMTAEVEFKSAGQMRRFQPPQWLGREVTGRDEYSNGQLAASQRVPREAIG